MGKQMTLHRRFCALALFACALVAPTAVLGVTVTGFSPTTATAGTIVTVTGTGFSTTKANDVIGFIGYNLTARSATATSLTFAVPVDWRAAISNFTVKVNGGSPVSSPSQLTVNAVISSISPTTVNVGDTLTIAGTNLGDPNGWIRESRMFSADIGSVP
jgi:IPT/TIG domain